MVLQLGLIITERCNIHCSHCLSDDVRSKNTARDMPIDDICCYIDRAAAISAKTNQRLSVSLSGGEPFLCYEKLLEGIRRANGNGAEKISTVSNGFWGSDEEYAFRAAAELKEAGLSLIYFSLDDFHQEYVPLAYVYQAVAACRQVGLAFGIKTVVTRKTSRLPEVLSGLGELLLGLRVIVEEIPCISEGSARVQIPEEDLLFKEGIPKDPCTMGMMLVIYPDGSTFPCCAPWNESLYLGNAGDADFDVLYSKMKDRPLLKILREKGPHFFVPHFEQVGHSLQPHRYIDNCDLCQRILTHPAVGQVLPVAIQNWRVDRVRKIMCGSILQELKI